MKMKTGILSLFCIASAFLCAAPTVEQNTPPEIRVELATSSPLLPIYISTFAQEGASFSAEYVQELESVFTFDFNYNGKTKVAGKSGEKEKTLSSKNTPDAFNTNLWKGYGIPYVVKIAIQGKQLSAQAFSSQSGSLKRFPEIALTGNMAQDRKIIHKLADGIHKAFFNEEGIAYSRVLYCYQYKATPSDGAPWTSEIWESDWDGANAHPITKEHSYCVSPVLIPKGGQFAKDMFIYVSYKTGQPKIFIADIEQGAGKKAVDIRGNQILPAISRQRDKLAFICDASGRTDLFIQPIRPENGQMGTPVQLFSYPRSTQASPTFSPDGSKIAFVSDKDGAARIYIISTSLTQKRPNATLLTKKNRENSCPAWSPDGTKIAYSAKTDGIRQIWIYELSSGEERQLTSGPGNKENPCWASNSMHLVFNSSDGNVSDLYLVNLNQPDAIKITKGTGKKHYPSWGTR